MKKTLMRKYARLIARMGANVQKGQPVLLSAAVDQSEFVAILVDECYKAGASRVDMEWSCQALTRLDYRHRTLKSLSTVPAWKEAKLKQMTEELPCRIVLLSEDPDGLKGVNQEKMQKARIATYPILKPYRDAIESRHQWCIAAIPSYEWARKVFPNEKKHKAYEMLWEAILMTVHVTEDNDPIAAWHAHNEAFRERCQWLNDQHFDAIEYHSANGTDFRAELIERGRWCGGGEYTKGGVFYNPNMPTEEIFTSPMSGKAEGKLVSTMPLSYQGQIIDKFWIEFRDGRAVAWDAGQGKELLTRMLTMDEGASRLGELALVPVDSPISRSGLLYYETLFDENASCHVALGAGYNDTLEGYMDLSNEECRALGINESMIHVDFMIGAPDLCITGYRNGVATPIFVNGAWAR